MKEPVTAFIVKYRVLLAVIVLAVAVGAGLLIARQHQELSLAEQVLLQHLQEAPTIEAMQPQPPVPLPPEEPKSAKPRLAIVIDDVGMTEEGTREAIALPAPVTLSFFPYAPHVQDKVNAAHAAGHEVFMHVPMEALGGQDPGPDAMRVDMDDETLRAESEKNLSSFTGYAGVNNHMGSKFTADEHAMRIFMEALKARGVIFLDSRTNMATHGESIAREMGIKTIRRHVFLDNTITEENVTNQMTELLKIADHQNMAVAIGHPHHITLETLAKLLPYLRDRYELVPVSALAK